jgi:hypothetical protein
MAITGMQQKNKNSYMYHDISDQDGQDADLDMTEGSPLKNEHTKHL